MIFLYTGRRTNAPDTQDPPGRLPGRPLDAGSLHEMCSEVDFDGLNLQIVLYHRFWI